MFLLKKIIGGENTTIDDYPWAALLRYRHEKKQIESWGCGGAYIGGRTIVTAAHCVGAQTLNDLGDLYVTFLCTIPFIYGMFLLLLISIDYSFVWGNSILKIILTALISLGKWTVPIRRSTSKSHVRISKRRKSFLLH